jgi:hypothetical protein
MTILPAAAAASPSPLLFIYLVIERDWPAGIRVPHAEGLSSTRCMTDNSVRDVLSCLDSFFSLHTHARMGNISKLLRREEETSATPKHTHTKKKKLIRTAWKIERFVVLCNTPMGGSERRRARSRPVSATYQHDRHDITAPPPNRTSCK